jgi:hypothetical protein
MLQSQRRNLAAHPIEVVGERLRAMMPWIKKNQLVDQSRIDAGISASDHRPRGLGVRAAQHRGRGDRRRGQPWWSLPFWLIAVFIVQFFRDPPRRSQTFRRRALSR